MANKPSIPKGTRDFLPEQSLKRQFIFDTAKSVFQLYGFQPIETPAMENLDTLTGKYGEEGDALLYRIIDSGVKGKRSLQEIISEVEYRIRFRLFTRVKELAHFIANELKKNEGHFPDSLENELILHHAKIEANENFDALVLSKIKDIENSYLAYLLATDSSGKVGVDHNLLAKNYFEVLYKTHPHAIESFLIGSINQWYDRSNLQNEAIKDLVKLMIDKSDLRTYRLSEKALRYDLTVPFARFVVQNQNELSFPFKRYQIQPVWRADRPQRGRYREFYQCDVDVIGSDSLLNEAELLCIVSDVFDALGLGDIQIRLNNRKILSGIAHATGLGDHFGEMTIAIDKLDKIGVDGVREEMIKRGLPAAGVKKALDHISRKADADTLLRMLSGSLTGELEGQKGIDEMRKTLKALPPHVRKKVSIDLTLARGLNYYTGAIIEVGHAKFPSSICGGGRYDDLTGIFGLKNMSGVGVSFGADRIYDLMEDLNLFPPTLRAASDILFINFGETEALECMQLAMELRAEGYSAEVYPDAAKMQKQMKYADARGFRFVILIGSEELKEELANVKDMTTGDQSSVLLSDLNNFIFDKLGSDD